MSPAGSTAILSALPEESWPACWRSYKAPAGTLWPRADYTAHIDFPRFVNEVTSR